MRDRWEIFLSRGGSVLVSITTKSRKAPSPKYTHREKTVPDP